MMSAAAATQPLRAAFDIAMSNHDPVAFEAATSTSAAPTPSSRREEGSKNRPSVSAACSTGAARHSINQPESDPPDRHGIRCPKLSDDGHVTSDTSQAQLEAAALHKRDTSQHD